MFDNQQEQLPKAAHDDLLRVFKIFPTIQGEGPLCGRACVFVRMYGCNLQCPQCDTDYSTHQTAYSPEALFQEIKKAIPPGKKYSLVVFTGGEPLRQNLSGICRLLIKAKYDIQFETNGTMWHDEMGVIMAHPRVTLICSPKTPNINQDIKQYIDHYKYIGTCDDLCEDDGLPTTCLGYQHRPYRPSVIEPRRIWLSPMDTENDGANKVNSRACLKSCLKHGYSYTHQLHKVVGVE